MPILNTMLYVFLQIMFCMCKRLNNSYFMSMIVNRINMFIIVPSVFVTIFFVLYSSFIFCLISSYIKFFCYLLSSINKLLSIKIIKNYNLLIYLINFFLKSAL